MQTVSNKTLIKSTVGATVMALVALVLFILPAEYNIDPTGMGNSLGLVKIAQASQTPTVPKAKVATGASSDVLEVVVPANRGVEFKFDMQQHAKMTYEWMTDGEPLYFDLHGEPQGDTTGYFESYAIATLAEMKGSFTAPFAGSHGWYWKNTTDQPVTVQLMVEGTYVITGLKQ